MLIAVVQIEDATLIELLIRAETHQRGIIRQHDHS